MFTISKLCYRSQFNPLIKSIFKNFQNKVRISKDNLTILNTPAYNKVTLKGLGENSIKDKTFYFDQTKNFDTIISELEKDYQVTLEFDNELKIASEGVLAGQKLSNKEADLAAESPLSFDKVEKIFEKLHIKTQQEKFEFLKKVVNNTDTQNIYKVKLLYFKLQADLEKMEKLKTRVDERAFKRTRLFLISLWLVLILQTAVFYHMIFNVDHLGWDLVEPSTYLLQSILLLVGVMTFTKFHRNYMTGAKLIEDSTRNKILKGYAKNNFNNQIYSELKREALIVKKYLNEKI